MGHGHHHHDHHDHHHGHAHGAARFGSAFALGVLLNAGFVVLEVVFGLAADSLALLADAAHNLGDVLSLLLAWGAMRLAQRLPSRRFTYGLRSSSILAAVVNAVALLLVTGALAWEAVRRLFDAPDVQGSIVIAVALTGVAINGLTAWLLMRGNRADLNVRSAYLHMIADAAVSLAVAAGGAIVLATGWLWIDPALTLAVSVVIVWSTWGVLRDALRLALQGVPPGIDLHDVRAVLERQPGVAEVHDLHVWAMSTTENALTAHLVVRGPHPGDAFLQAAAHQLDERFGIRHTTLQVELGDTAHACALAPDDVV